LDEHYWQGEKIVSILKTARVILEPTPPSGQYLMGDLCPEVEQPGRKSDYYAALTVDK
jgi:hypothetical protein